MSRQVSGSARLTCEPGVTEIFTPRGRAAPRFRAVTTQGPVDAASSSNAARCAECSSPLAHDQRYCLECGARRGPLPRHLAAMITRPAPPAADVDPPAGDALDAMLRARRRRAGASGLAARARATAVAILSMLAFGVVAGSLVKPEAESLARTSSSRCLPRRRPRPRRPLPTQARRQTAVARGGGGGGGSSSGSGSGSGSSAPADSLAPARPRCRPTRAPATGTGDGGGGGGGSWASPRSSMCS